MEFWSGGVKGLSRLLASVDPDKLTQKGVSRGLGVPWRLLWQQNWRNAIHYFGDYCLNEQRHIPEHNTDRQSRDGHTFSKPETVWERTVVPRLYQNFSFSNNQKCSRNSPPFILFCRKQWFPFLYFFFVFTRLTKNNRNDNKKRFLLLTWIQ